MRHLRENVRQHVPTEASHSQHPHEHQAVPVQRLQQDLSREGGLESPRSPAHESQAVRLRSLQQVVHLQAPFETAHVVAQEGETLRLRCVREILQNAYLPEATRVRSR